MPHTLKLREVKFRLAHGCSTVMAPSGAKVLDVRFHLETWVAVTLLVSEEIEKNKDVELKFLVITPTFPISVSRMPVIKQVWSRTHKRYPDGVQIIHYR